MRQTTDGRLQNWRNLYLDRSRDRHSANLCVRPNHRKLGNQRKPQPSFFSPADRVDYL